jgi:dienelactone hydrolase
MEYFIHNEVDIPAGEATLRGELIIPKEAGAVIIFSHGSGSSRKSPRNSRVAQHLQQHHFGTLLMDLLTEKEDLVYENRFDISLLTRRLTVATRWLEQASPAHGLRLGYFGASTGAASALKAAAHLPEIGAVVSRGGRPDLAGEELSKVKSPTLLIVGSLDDTVLELNQQALQQLTCEKKLEVVEGASHLFEEPGKLDQAAALAASWFQQYLQPVTTH